MFLFQDILETKERELVVDQNREDRLATSLTDQMYQEAQVYFISKVFYNNLVLKWNKTVQTVFNTNNKTTQLTVLFNLELKQTIKHLLSGSKLYIVEYGEKHY